MESGLSKSLDKVRTVTNVEDEIDQSEKRELIKNSKDKIL